MKAKVFHMKILVTGGAGFVGSNLAEELSKLGNDVVVLDNFFLGTEKNTEGLGVDVIKGDLRDAEAVNKACNGVDVIFNQAAASSSPMFAKNLREAVAVNVDGFVNILNAAKENGTQRIVYASTSSLYGNTAGKLREDMKITPPNFYSATKLANENLARVFTTECGIETVGLRYMSVYGPREEGKGVFANLVSQFLWAMQKNEQPVIYGNGAQTRDFVYVKDVVQANILAMEKNKIGSEIFNVGTGTATSLNSLISLLNRLLGKNIQPKYIEIPVKNYIDTQLSDIAKIKTVLGYAPQYTLEDGIKDVLGLE